MYITSCLNSILCLQSFHQVSVVACCQSCLVIQMVILLRILFHVLPGMKSSGVGSRLIKHAEAKVQNRLDMDMHAMRCIAQLWPSPDRRLLCPWSESVETVESVNLWATSKGPTELATSRAGMVDEAAKDCAAPQVLQSIKHDTTKTTQKYKKRTHVFTCSSAPRHVAWSSDPGFKRYFKQSFEELVYAVIYKVPSNLPKLLFLLSVQHSALSTCNAQLERTCSWFHDMKKRTCEVKKTCLQKVIRSFIIDVILAWKVQMAKPASMLYLKPPILFKAVNQFTNSSQNSSPIHWLSECFECFLVPWDVSFLC